MKALKKHIVTGMAGLTLLLSSAWVAAELVVIAHSTSSVSHLSLDQVREIYLGNSTEFPDGKKAIPVDQKDGTSAKTEFLAKVLRKDPGEVKAIWSKIIFAGHGVPPSVVGSDREVKEWVSHNPGGLGYVDKSVVDDSVKVLLSVP